MNELKRRTFLASGGVSLGSAALANFLARDAAAQTVAALPPGAIGLPHFPPRVKRVIFLCMAGGPSHLETFDHKPKLAEMNGQPMPESFTKGQPIAQMDSAACSQRGSHRRETVWCRVRSWLPSQTSRGSWCSWGRGRCSLQRFSRASGDRPTTASPANR